MVMFMYAQCCVTMVMTAIYIGDVYYVAITICVLSAFNYDSYMAGTADV